MIPRSGSGLSCPGQMKACLRDFTNQFASLGVWAVVLIFGVALVAYFPCIAYAQVEQTTSEAAYNDELIRCAVSGLFGFIEVPFGALIMVLAGILAIISAAMGGYRTAVSLIIVAVGAFILRSLVSLFFGVDFPECSF